MRLIYFFLTRDSRYDSYDVTNDIILYPDSVICTCDSYGVINDVIYLRVLFSFL
jgi:hypothetical protein